MATEYRIHIDVDIAAPAPTNNPASLCWEYVRVAGDNPRLFGAELVAALKGALERAVAGAQMYVDGSPTDGD